MPELEGEEPMSEGLISRGIGGDRRRAILEGRHKEAKKILRKCVLKKFGESEQGNLSELVAGLNGVGQLEDALEHLMDCGTPEKFARYLQRVSISGEGQVDDGQVGEPTETDREADTLGLPRHTRLTRSLMGKFQDELEALGSRPELEDISLLLKKACDYNTPRIRLEGISGGRREEAREMLRRLALKKFGANGKGELSELVAGITHVRQLEQALDYLLECDASDQFARFVRRASNGG